MCTGSTQGKGFQKLPENLLLGQGPYGSFSLDPLVGILHVRTSSTRLATIAQMLTCMQKQLAQQVIIDAQILEV